MAWRWRDRWTNPPPVDVLSLTDATLPGFQYQVGRPLTWNDFEESAFCTLEYDDSNPNASPDVIADKGKALFHTKCEVPQRNGRHVIYGERGRNHFTFERFHSCMDVVFNASSGFSLAATEGRVSLAAGESKSVPLTIARTGGFSAGVTLSVTGLPNGVTGSFNPETVNSSAATLTLTAASNARASTATLLVTRTSGATVATVPVIVEVNGQPDFSLSGPSQPLSVSRGQSVTQPVAISRQSGFSGAVNFTASGLPSGVTAAFAPATTDANSTALTLHASTTALTGPATIVVTGSSGSLSRKVDVAIAVAPPENQSFSVSLNSPSVSLTPGGSGATTIGITRVGGFASPVLLAASQLPAGITAIFEPASVAGLTTTTKLTLSASEGTIAGKGTALVTATGGGLTRTLPVPFSVTGGSNPGGGVVTVVPRINVSQPWYTELSVHLVNTVPITALQVGITIQKTPAVNHAGQYNTIGTTVQQSSRNDDARISYEYVLAPSQTLASGTHRVFAAQASGNGTAHPTSGDAWEVTYTTGGTTITHTGRF